MKTVWIINHYTELVATGGSARRHQSLAVNLPKHGWNPVLFLASTGYPVGRQYLTGRGSRRLGTEDGVAHVILKAPAYSGLATRAINMLGFAVQLLRARNIRGLPRPDLIIGSTVHPLAAWAALRLSKRLRTPFVFEIRDVWPDALVHLGKLRERSVVARLMRSLMRSMVARAALVISPLPAVDTYLRNLGYPEKPFLWVSNGAEADENTGIVRAKSESPEFVFMYLGSYANSMALETLIDAFALMRTRRPDANIRFRLVGDGPRRAAVEAHATAVGGGRIVFEDRIPRGLVHSRAQEADCLVHALYDHPVYSYGISPNKIYDYLLAGRPVIFATNSINDPVHDAGAGFSVPAENVSAVADAMIRLYDTPLDERFAMGERGRAHILEHYTYGALAARLAEGLDEAVADESRCT